MLNINRYHCFIVARGDCGVLKVYDKFVKNCNISEYTEVRHADPGHANAVCQSLIWAFYGADSTQMQVNIRDCMR